MALRAVVFDLDETLIVEEQAVVAALEATARLVLGERSADATALARSVRAAARELWRAYPAWPWANQVGISSWEGLCATFAGDDPRLRELANLAPHYRLAAWQRGLQECGIPDDGRAALLAERYVREHEDRRVPYPESLGVLRALRGRFRLGLLTNGAPDLQRGKVAAAGLSELFDAIVVSGELGVGKPHPWVFHEILGRLDVAPEATVMVGDSLERDVAGACLVGMRAVWVDRAGTGYDAGARPDGRIRDLSGLEDVIARW